MGSVEHASNTIGAPRENDVVPQDNDVLIIKRNMADAWYDLGRNC